MKRLTFIAYLFACSISTAVVGIKHIEAIRIKTFCNPMDLNYRFQPRGLKAFREAADPLITMYKGKYFLFASHSGGYWHSDDMLNWKYIPIKSLPLKNTLRMF
jgi:hypothetical protein